MIYTMKYQSAKKWFTIPELLVVATIISILSTIGFITYSKYTSQARDSVRSSDLKNITRILTLHESRISQYPQASSGVAITYSGATLWTQWTFWKETVRETWKIFWDLTDPLHKNEYSYSVTNNQKEYQLSAVFESVESSTNLIASNVSLPSLYETSYAAWEFSPLEFSPKIWLDGSDIDGDGDTNDNPSDGSTISTWVNKSSAWSANNPTVTHSSIQFTSDWFFNSYPGVFISNADGLLLNNSDISSGDIFYVVQKADPFNSNVDSNWYGLYSTISGNYKIWYHNNYRNALRIGWAPRHHNSAPASTNNRTAPFIYSFHTNSSNYTFRDTSNIISQGATNSIAWHEWAFNKWWAVTNKNSDLVVSEVLIFDSSLSSQEREKIEWYLAHKWGQDYFLPSSHPYKDEAPEWSTPPPTDSTPDSYVFSDVSDANLSTLYTSNAVTITGINTAANISVIGWEYSINSTSSYTTAWWSVTVWDVVRVRWTSSSSSSTATNVTLTVWWVSESFTITTIAADMTPDSFSFSAVSDAETSTQYTSNSITVSWLNVSVPISISWPSAEYKITDGVPFDVASGGTASASSTYSSNSPGHGFDNNTSSNWWGNGGSLPAWLKYDLWAWNAQVVSSYTLYRSSSQSGWWNWWGYSPRNWTFEWSDDNSNWTVLDTRTNESISANSTKKTFSFTNFSSYRYYRINISSARWNTTWINITEMELIDNLGWGVFTSSAWNVSNWDIVIARIPSSSSAGTTVSAEVTIGTSTWNFDVTTIAPDSTPDNFSFIDRDNANLSTVYESNDITISGINTSASISISGVWEYRKNGWLYTTSAGTVVNGDVIQVRQTSSSSNSVTVSSTITIGWVSWVYNVTTPAPPPDSDPDPFSFTSITNANVSTLYTSNNVTISWINTASSISISAGEYDINGSKSYTSSAWTVNNGDVISVRNTSSSTPGNTVSLRLTIWGTEFADFDITTIPEDNSPLTFNISDQTGANINTLYESDPVIVWGINVPVLIDITAWSWEYSINNGAWSSSLSSVNNGDSVIVRNTSSSSWLWSISTTLEIGDQSDSFVITNWPGDTTPDNYIFQSVSDANLNSQYTSNTITITGINAPTSISITGWEYRVWEVGSFTTSPGNVENNDEITVRLVSAIVWNTARAVSLDIGWVVGTYSVTTMDFTPAWDETPTYPVSNTFVWWDYNGLIVHTNDGPNHYVIASPSIMTYDTSDTDILSIIQNKKLVYDGFDNIPASYAGTNLTLSGGFDFTISDPILYEWNKQDLGSYGWLKQIDEWIRSIYWNFEWYQRLASYLDDYSLWYLETIMSQSIGINPIKPYYCSDILRSKLIFNVAPDATITASPTNYNSYGTWGIANGVKSTDWDLDYEYHSASWNANITFEWEESKKIWYVRIYNRTWCCSDRLSGANIKLFNEFWGLIYSHSLWDTTNDFVVDLDLEWIGHLYDVSRLSIETVGGNFLNIREVELFLGWNVEDGIYKVDKDGLWGQSPYNVYCDMTTDGWGWTRIGENYISNWNFENQNHVGEHTFGDSNAINDNLIVARVTQAPPSTLPEAFSLQHNGSSTESYELFFEDIPWEFFAQEIRLTAWVKGTSSSVFQNTLNYIDGSSETSTPDYDVIDSDGVWEKHFVRIPLEWLVSNFTWSLWDGIPWPFYVTGLDMEVYYR